MLKVNVFIGSIVYILMSSIKLYMFIIYFKMKFSPLNAFEHYGRNICLGFLSTITTVCIACCVAQAMGGTHLSCFSLWDHGHVLLCPDLVKF